MRLREWQRRWIYRLYEYHPETGERRYKRALKGVGKGNGKTPEAAWVGAYELLGGVHTAPRVIIGAASLKQANLVFGDLRVCVTESPTLAPHVEAFDLQILLAGGRPGLAERIAAEAGTNDGARATSFIADELHEWNGQRARVHMVVAGALSKRRDAFNLNISTAGVDEPGSLLKGLYDHGRLVASGELTDDEFLFEWYEAPTDLDLDDPDQWRAAIDAANPAAGDFLRIASLEHRWRTMPRFEFERYHLNRWTKTARHWLEPGAWAALPATKRPKAGTRAVLAFDGSYRGDSSALIGCTLTGRVWVEGLWENPGDDRWRVPRAEVEARVITALQRYDVAELAVDPFGWFEEIERWEERWGELVVRFETNQRSRMGPACSRFFTAVGESAMRHDHNPALERHLANCVPKETPQGTIVTKEYSDSPRKIDAAVGAIVAYARAMHHAQQPEPQAPTVMFV